jgi:type IV pilus assembly protein PilM
LSSASISVTLAERGPLGNMLHWLDAMPHPTTACEIAAGHVAVAAWSGGRLGTEGFAMEPLPEGAVSPSPVESNIARAEAVRAALERALRRVRGRGQTVALLVPDPVVRVFLLNFETFPRGEDEAIPLLRWRLKKSVPFDVEETVVSYMAQGPRGAGVEILAGMARQKIIRQYEELAEAAGLHAGVVLSSTLAVLPLLDEDRPVLLARAAGSTLTTAIVRGQVLCVYRCTEMGGDAARVEAQALLDEIYPAAAFYQDTWRESVRQVRLAGFGARAGELRAAVEAGIGAPAAPLSASPVLAGQGPGDARALVEQRLDALAGWMMNRGA